jgi:hypothetical protein
MRVALNYHLQYFVKLIDKNCRPNDGFASFEHNVPSPKMLVHMSTN